MKARCLPLLLLLVGSPVMAEQTCDTRSYPLSAPDARYIDNGDGTLTDTKVNMMWMRCSLGQNWTGTSCAGTPSAYTWQSAQDAAKELDEKGGFAGHADWRVPHIPELAMITERQCESPRINLKQFPNTPSVFYWTATTRRGAGLEAQAYELSFGPEGAKYAEKTEANLVRLMRKAQ